MHAAQIVANGAQFGEDTPPQATITTPPQLDLKLSKRGFSICGYVSGQSGIFSGPSNLLQVLNPKLTTSSDSPLICENGYECVTTTNLLMVPSWSCCDSFGCLGANLCNDYLSKGCSGNDFISADVCSQVYGTVLTW